MLCPSHAGDRRRVIQVLIGALLWASLAPWASLAQTEQLVLRCQQSIIAYTCLKVLTQPLLTIGLSPVEKQLSIRNTSTIQQNNAYQYSDSRVKLARYGRFVCLPQCWKVDVQQERRHQLQKDEQDPCFPHGI